VKKRRDYNERLFKLGVDNYLGVGAQPALRSSIAYLVGQTNSLVGLVNNVTGLPEWAVAFVLGMLTLWVLLKLWGVIFGVTPPSPGSVAMGEIDAVSAEFLGMVSALLNR
jgi:hypothetical protein